MPLHRESHYQAQANPVRIDTQDEAIILPYINWESITPLKISEQKPTIYFLDNPEERAKVEDFSVDCAVSEVRQWYPTAEIEVKEHNNPGFDLVVTQNGKVLRYIEVKGTQTHKPIFHYTENERQFSKNNSDLYTLLVVWMIDLENKTYRITKYDGEVTVDNILQPYRYLGELNI